MVAGIIETYAKFSIPLSDTIIADGYDWLQTNASGGSMSSLKGETGRQMIAAVVGVDVEDINAE